MTQLNLSPVNNLVDFLEKYQDFPVFSDYGDTKKIINITKIGEYSFKLEQFDYVFPILKRFVLIEKNNNPTKNRINIFTKDFDKVLFKKHR